jgi:hypothetical protein
MTSVTAVEWLRLPLAPLIVSVLVPVLALRFTVTVKVVVPEPVTELGLKPVETRDGAPLTLKLTAALKPFTGAIVTL